MQHIYKKISFLFLLACVMLTPSAFVSADHTNAHTIETLQAQITSLMAQIADLQKRIADSTEGNGGSTRVPTIVPAVCPRFTYNFYLGMDDTETGGQVTELQNILAADSEIYPEALITGYYGPLTEQAVRRYQKRHSIVSSGSPDTTGYGVVGPATRGKLVQGCGQPAPIPGVVPLRASLKISSPNGGESWQMRSEQAVRWSSLESFSYVDVDLLSWSPPLPPCQECPAIASAPSFSAAILRRAPNTGYLSWRVGNILSDSIVPAGTYVIRVSNSENANVYDQSDSYFKIVQNGTSTNNPPVISGVSGPTTLNVGQSGTWTVKASDPENGYLSYDVCWGDGTCGMPGGFMQTYDNTLAQTATFTHSYTKQGIYSPTFSVLDSNGLSAKTSISVNVGNSVTPSITVLSPKQGDQWLVGKTYRINWSPFPPTADTFVYLSGGGNAEGYSKYVGGPSIGTNYYFDYTVTNSDLPVKSGSSWKVAVCDGKMKPGGNDCGWSGEVFVGSFEDSAVKYRDTRRIVDVKQLQLALELYWDAKQSYPSSLYLLVPTYLRAVPEDPLGNMYHYVTLPDGCAGNAANPCTEYHMGSSLESTSSVLSNDADYNSTVLPGGINGSDQGPCRPIGAGIIRYCYDVVVMPSTVTSPSIQVLSPNGGETWSVGSIQPLSWKMPDDKRYEIHYFLIPQGSTPRGGTATFNTAVGGYDMGGASLALPTSHGSHSIQAPSGVPFGTYKFRMYLSAYTEYGIFNIATAIAYDDSDAPFSIVATAQPSITVLSPNGGETWEVGKPYQISWSFSGSAERLVDIKLVDMRNSFNVSPNPIAVIASGISIDNTGTVAGRGTYTWTIPSTITPLINYGIAIYVRGEANSIDASNAPFTISALPSPQLTFTGTQNYTGSDGNPYIKYSLSVSNRSSYPDSMFTSAPNLPPCGLNTNSSRTWVNVYNAANNSYVYGFCGLTSAQDLTSLWFGIPQGSNSPQSVYITINDRQTGVVYRSNTVVTQLPDLTVSDIYNDGGTLSIKVQNIGTADAPIDTGHLYIWIDDKLVWTYSVSTWSNKDYRLVGGVTIVQPQILTGTRKIRATIDPNGAVSEANENNNILEKTITF